jgi:hypothetical protein
MEQKYKLAAREADTSLFIQQGKSLKDAEVWIKCGDQLVCATVRISEVRLALKKLKTT